MRAPIRSTASVRIWAIFTRDFFRQALGAQFEGLSASALSKSGVPPCPLTLTCCSLDTVLALAMGSGTRYAAPFRMWGFVATAIMLPHNERKALEGRSRDVHHQLLSSFLAATPRRESGLGQPAIIRMA
jgi:hypothetical protein